MIQILVNRLVELLSRSEIARQKRNFLCPSGIHYTNGWNVPVCDYLRLLSSAVAAAFLSRFAAFFSFAVDAAGFFAAFWPLSLDMMSSFPGMRLPYRLTIAHWNVGHTYRRSLW